MTRDLYIKTKTDVRRYTLGKNVRFLTVVERGLYRTDHKLMIRDKASDHELVLYDKGSTQPHYTATPDCNPDITMAYIDIIKAAGQKVTRLGFLTNINPSWLIYGIVGCVIIYAVISGGIA